MDTPQATRGAQAVGLITTVIGVVLVVAPDRPARILHLDDPGELRIIGVSDLVLAPGLLSGPRRWPWMAARVGVNLAVIAHFRRRAATTADHRLLDGTAALLAALCVQDVRIARTLHRGNA